MLSRTACGPAHLERASSPISQRPILLLQRSAPPTRARTLKTSMAVLLLPLCWWALIRSRRHRHRRRLCLAEASRLGSVKAVWRIPDPTARAIQSSCLRPCRRDLICTRMPCRRFWRQQRPSNRHRRRSPCCVRRGAAAMPRAALSVAVLGAAPRQTAVSVTAPTAVTRGGRRPRRPALDALSLRPSCGRRRRRPPRGLTLSEA